jgi:branched-chain amino acid aminotransferase
MIDLIGYKNGEYLPLDQCGPSILDFGFIHCDATYDVMPIYNGKAFCLDRHLNRFVASADYYKLKLPDVYYLGIIRELYKRNPIDNAFVWFMVWRGYPESGNPRDIENAPINFAMYIKPSYPLKVDGAPMNVELSHGLRVNDSYYWQQSKNMAWIEFTQSQLIRGPSYDTVVLQDGNGYITEGPGFNVGFVWEDYIYTPLNNCLQGVTMSVVEDICEDNFERCNIKIDMWSWADEIFLTSSSGGITKTQRSYGMTEWLQEEYIKRTKDDEYTTAC